MTLVHGSSWCGHHGEIVDGKCAACWKAEARQPPIRLGELTCAQIPNPMETGQIDLSHGEGYGWRVISDCGVVKVYSTRDGCMIALNSAAARRVAQEFYDAMLAAADATDIRGYGYIIDAEGRRAE